MASFRLVNRLVFLLLCFCVISLFFFIGSSYNPSEGMHREEKLSMKNSNNILIDTFLENDLNNDNLTRKTFVSTTWENTPEYNLTTFNFQDIFRFRSEEMKRKCSTKVRPQTRNSPIDPREFLINEKFGLTWCNIFKAASSSWFEFFLKLANVKLKKNVPQVQMARRSAYPRPSLETLMEVLNNTWYKSFVILREPFERILSSYNSKLADKESRFYHQVRCAMANVNPKKSKHCYPTFSQYIDYIINEYDTGEHMDEHWHPYSTFCSLCQVNYDYILRFETVEEEQNYIVQSGVARLSGYEFGHSNPSHLSYPQLTSEFYSQLSREQLNRLVEIYKDDFLLSGHSWQKYYNFIEDKDQP